MNAPFFNGCTAVLIVALLSVPSAASQEKRAGNDGTLNQQMIADIRRALLAEITIADVQEERSFLDFMELLAGKTQVPIQIDEDAFGGRLFELVLTRVKLPAFPKRMPGFTAVRLALGQLLHDLPVDYRCMPTHFALTSPERAAYRKTYDVSDLIKSKPFLPADAGRSFGWGESGSKHPAAFFVESISPGILRGPIQIINDASILIHSNDSGHAEIANTIDSYRRLADMAVILNARLLEVDGDFHARELQPLFAKGKGKGRTAKIGDELAEQLKSQKVIVEDAGAKVRQTEKVRCLSLHTVWHALPDGKLGAGLGRYGTCLEGISVFAQPEVTPDRRGVRLKLVQESASVLEVKKKKVLDLTIDTEVEVQWPVLEGAKVSASIDVEDSTNIIMDVSYRPFPARMDRRWVIWMRPRIYIEEEEEAMRKGMLEPLPVK